MNTPASARVHAPAHAFATALPLALAYLRDRLLSTLLNVVLLGLGIATIVTMLLTVDALETRMERDAAAIDLVVGAKGSPLQLVLSAVFHADIPTGNIQLAEAERIGAEPAVKRAIPLALGDSVRGFRIVGTSADYLDLYAARLAAGRTWSAPFETVIGAEVAARTGLAPGAGFAGSHGFSGGREHAGRRFEVVGVLKPTGSVIDRLVLTGIDSVWRLHADGTAGTGGEGGDGGKPREITALLIQYATPLAAASFPRRVNAASGLQAAAPATESARLFALAGVGISALKLFAGVMLACAALGIFVGLTNALDERRADLALLRLLGASPATVFLTILAQGFALGTAGVILGLLLGHGGAAWIGSVLESAHHVPLTGWSWAPGESWVILATLALTGAAGAIPAWRAYRDAVPALLNR